MPTWGGASESIVMRIPFKMEYSGCDEMHIAIIIYILSNDKLQHLVA
jgi:hypothetical protein